MPGIFSGPCGFTNPYNLWVSNPDNLVYKELIIKKDTLAQGNGYVTISS